MPLVMSTSRREKNFLMLVPLSICENALSISQQYTMARGVCTACPQLGLLFLRGAAGMML